MSPSGRPALAPARAAVGRLGGRWLDMGRWDLAGGPPVTLEQLERRPCYVGLDLSTTTDLTTL